MRSASMTSQGTVEYIGVKSTRLRSVSGEQIILSNADILKARVRNFGRQHERRSLFRLDVHYETPVAALAAVPRAVQEIIEATPETRFERCHLLGCGGPALQFEVVYFVTNPEFQVYADAQQSINLRILERFRTLEVTFQAVAPTQVHVHQPPAPGGGRRSGTPAVASRAPCPRARGTSSAQSPGGSCQRQGSRVRRFMQQPVRRGCGTH